MKFITIIFIIIAVQYGAYAETTSTTLKEFSLDSNYSTSSYSNKATGNFILEANQFVHSAISKTKMQNTQPPPSRRWRDVDLG